MRKEMAALPVAQQEPRGPESGDNQNPEPMTIVQNTEPGVKPGFAARILNAIGIRRATNQEVLLDELAELDGDTFDYLVLSRMSNFPEKIEDLHCEDCNTLHGGRCLHEEDKPCPLTTAQWLAMPCQHDHILEVNRRE